MPVKKSGRITRAQLAKRTKKELISLLKEYPAFGISAIGKGKMKKSDLVDAMVKSPKWDCLSKTLPPRTKRKQSTKQKANFEKMIKNRVNRQLESIVYPDTLSTPAKRKEAREKNLLKEKVLAYENPDYLKLKRVQSPDYFRIYPELVSVEAKQREAEALKGIITKSSQETAELAHRVDVESLIQEQHRKDLEELIQGLTEEKGEEEIKLGDVEDVISIEKSAPEEVYLTRAREVANILRKYTRAQNRLERVSGKSGRRTEKDEEKYLKSQREIKESIAALEKADRASLYFIGVSSYLKRFVSLDDLRSIYDSYDIDGLDSTSKAAYVDALLSNSSYYNQISDLVNRMVERFQPGPLTELDYKQLIMGYLLETDDGDFKYIMERVVEEIVDDVFDDQDITSAIQQGTEHSSTRDPDIFGDSDIDTVLAD